MVLFRFLVSVKRPFACQVMEILVHVNKRVKSRVNVQMPVRQLLTEFGSQSASVFFKVCLHLTRLLDLLLKEKKNKFFPVLYHYNRPSEIRATIMEYSLFCFCPRGSFTLYAGRGCHNGKTGLPIFFY